MTDKKNKDPYIDRKRISRDEGNPSIAGLSGTNFGIKKVKSLGDVACDLGNEFAKKTITTADGLTYVMRSGEINKINILDRKIGAPAQFTEEYIYPTTAAGPIIYVSVETISTPEFSWFLDDDGGCIVTTESTLFGDRLYISSADYINEGSTYQVSGDDPSVIATYLEQNGQPSPVPINRYLAASGVYYQHLIRREDKNEILVNGSGSESDEYNVIGYGATCGPLTGDWGSDSTTTNTYLTWLEEWDIETVTLVGTLSPSSEHTLVREAHAHGYSIYPPPPPEEVHCGADVYTEAYDDEGYTVNGGGYSSTYGFYYYHYYLSDKAYSSLFDGIALSCSVTDTNDYNSPTVVLGSGNVAVTEGPVGVQPIIPCDIYGSGEYAYPYGNNSVKSQVGVYGIEFSGEDSREVTCNPSTYEQDPLHDQTFVYFFTKDGGTNIEQLGFEATDGGSYGPHPIDGYDCYGTHFASQRTSFNVYVWAE